MGVPGPETIPHLSLKEADLAPFTNLKKVQDIGGFLRPRARTALVKHGIEVED